MPNPLLQCIPHKRSYPFLLTLTIVLIFAGAFVGLSHSYSAHAAGPTLTLHPTSSNYSPPDSRVVVQGNRFSSDETVKVYWNYTGQGSGTLEAAATTDGSGTFFAQFAPPLASTGTYTVAGIGQTSGLNAIATFLLLPNLSISPEASGPNTLLTFAGDAFGAGEAVKIYWNYTGPGTGTLLSTATGNGTGSFTFTAHVPLGTSPGDTIVAGVGQSSQTVAKHIFTLYTPAEMLAPLSGSVSTALTVSAYGFKGNEKVSIFWNNGMNPLAIVKADLFGYIAPTITVPPGSAPGSYAVKVLGQTSHVTATNTFVMLAPASQLSIASGPVGVKVKVTGQGYAPNEQVGVYWNYTGPGTGNSVANVTTGTSGAFNVGFAVPLSVSGAFNVAAVGTTSKSVTQNAFTVATGLAASPAIRAPGTISAVSGTGYQANEAVKLFWDNISSPLLATSTADSQGNISQVVTFPANATPGSHTIIGVGQASGRSFTATATVQTNWGDFGFDFAHHRENIYENSLTTGNVGSLNLKWSAPMTHGFEDSVVYANGLIYVVTTDGILDAYVATTGILQWQFNTNTGFKNYSSPVVDPANGIVFFGTTGRGGSGIRSPVYALNAQTGALQWSLILAGNDFAFPTLGAQTIYMGVSNEGATSSIYAIDEISGHILWQHSANGGVWGAIGLDTVTHALFSIVGNPSDQVISLKMKTGAQLWQHTLPNSNLDDDPGSGITVANGQVYLDDKNGFAYGLDEYTGNQIWATQIGSEFTTPRDVSTQAVSASGVLYVGSQDTNLYALNALTGAVLWKTPTGGGIDSSPAIANGVVYFASFDSKIYAVDATSGSVLWSYLTKNLSFSSPIIANGWLYCGSTDGKLYAFSL
jgi:outer membrane protein assembly factor BamB